MARIINGSFKGELANCQLRILYSLLRWEKVLAADFDSQGKSDNLLREKILVAVLVTIDI